MKWKVAALVLVGVVPVVAACTTGVSSVDQGLALYRDGRYGEAVLAFDNAVLKEPYNVAALNDRGAARMHVGQLVGALGDYTKAIELSPVDPELYLNRANVYMALGNHDFAIQDLNRAISIAPGYAKAYFNRGTARLRLGDTAGADADWRYAIATEPDPWTQAAMVRSAGLGAPSTRAAVADIPGTLTAGPPSASTVPSASPTGVWSGPAGPSTVAPTAPAAPAAPTAPSLAPSALPAQGAPAAAADALDARALALRGVSRQLDGDLAGAMTDLRAAEAKETDPARRARLATLVRALESSR